MLLMLLELVDREVQLSAAQLGSPGDVVETVGRLLRTESGFAVDDGEEPGPWPFDASEVVLVEAYDRVLKPFGCRPVHGEIVVEVPLV